MIGVNDERALTLTSAIRSGDTAGLEVLLDADPELATERIGTAAESRTSLHLATDWPANFPNVASTIRLLVAAGAAVDGRFVGPHHRETALHWAASADDVAAIDALLDAGADIEADGAVHTGGTALSDAVIFAQLNAAHRLVQRGARMTVWQAAALGEVAEVQRWLGTGALAASEVVNACWHACRTGQFNVVMLLVEHGADLDWVGHDQLTPRQAGAASGNLELAKWLNSEAS